jgi:hypothetical protein
MGSRTKVAACAVGWALGAHAFAIAQHPPADLEALDASRPTYVEAPGAGGVASTLRQASRPEETAPKPADLLLNAIVTWLSTNFELPADYNHPSVEFATPERIRLLRFGVAGSDGQREVMGVYVDRMRTILLPQGWTGRTPAELSVLVHELVHHLQNLGKRIYFCPEAREKLAYEAQEKWLGLFGRSLLQDFQIDPLTLKVATACM